jgi:threonine aldolase
VLVNQALKSTNSDLRSIALSSDTSAPAHPNYIRAVKPSVSGYEKTYSMDDASAKAEQKLKEIFGDKTQVFFVNNGTSANTALLKAVMNSTHAVLCSDVAHMAHRAGGSLEANIGCKVIQIPHQNGKLTPKAIQKAIEAHDSKGTSHKNQERVISISQPTETGSLYTLNEIRAIAQLAHKQGLLLHMDGSRLFHAADALKADLKAMTSDCGVDLLYLGGYKNNMILAEAMLFLPPFYQNYPNSLKRDYLSPESTISITPNNFRRYIKIVLKQLGNLNAKSAFLATQFMTAFENNLAMQTAQHANKTAKQLSQLLKDVPGINLYQPTETNVLMLAMPKGMKTHLDKRFSYVKTLIPDIPGKPGYVGVRLMTHGMTQPEELTALRDWLASYQQTRLS